MISQVTERQLSTTIVREGIKNALLQVPTGIRRGLKLSGLPRCKKPWKTMPLQLSTKIHQLRLLPCLLVLSVNTSLKPRKKLVGWVITIEESRGMETELEVVEGNAVWSRLQLSAVHEWQTAKMVADLNPYLDYRQEDAPISKKSATSRKHSQSNRPSWLLRMMWMSSANSCIEQDSWNLQRRCCQKLLALVTAVKAMLEDIAILTQVEPSSQKDLGLELKDATIEALVKPLEVTVDQRWCWFIVEGAGNPWSHSTRVAVIKSQIETTTTDSTVKLRTWQIVRWCCQSSGQEQQLSRLKRNENSASGPPTLLVQPSRRNRCWWWNCSLSTWFQLSQLRIWQMMKQQGRSIVLVYLEEPVRQIIQCRIWKGLSSIVAWRMLSLVLEFQRSNWWIWLKKVIGPVRLAVLPFKMQHL